MAKIKTDYENVMKMIRQICPDTVIFSCLVPPTRDNRTNGRIRQLNGFIQQLTQNSSGMFWLAPAVLDKQFFSWDKRFQCYLHFNYEGKRMFVNNLMSLLNGPFQVIQFLHQT